MHIEADQETLRSEQAQSMSSTKNWSESLMNLQHSIGVLKNVYQLSEAQKRGEIEFKHVGPSTDKEEVLVANFEKKRSRLSDTLVEYEK